MSKSKYQNQMQKLITSYLAFKHLSLIYHLKFDIGYF